MKVLLCLCSILFFICTVSFPFTVAQESTAVLDSDGDELKVGTMYYVVSAVPGAGAGGLTVSNYTQGACPITVSQELFNSNGLPCTFHPADSTESIIQLSKSLNVRFESSVTCAKSTVWKVGNSDPITGLPLIQIEGELGKPGCDTYENWFKIENAPVQGSYTFVSDPDDVCNTQSQSYNLTVAWAIEQRPALLSKNSQFQANFIKYDCATGNKAYVQ